MTGAEADGYGRGEGYAAVVLEPATAGGRALALFAGSAVNQDGRSSGLTAPHGPSQQALLMAAMREAGAAALEYVATHGTGGRCCFYPAASGSLLPAGCATWLDNLTSCDPLWCMTSQFCLLLAGTPLGDPIETGALRKAVAQPGAAPGEHLPGFSTCIAFSSRREASA